MTAKIKSEMSVGLTSEIESALQIATEFQGMKPAVLPAAVVLRWLSRGGRFRCRRLDWLLRLGKMTIENKAFRPPLP